MLYVVRGVDGVIVNGHTIDPDIIPPSFQAVGYRTLLGIPWMALIVAVVVVDRRLHVAALPLGPGPLRHRVQPGGRRSWPESRPDAGSSPRS